MKLIKIMSQSINAESLKNILTLRYDPTSQSRLQKIEYHDFSPKLVKNEVNVTEELLKNSILKSLKDYSKSRITLALSSGIDSVLVLTLIREIFPEIKITCVSVGFEENDEEVISAKETARKQNCDFKQIKLDNFMNNLPQQIAIIKEPKWHYYWYYLAQEAKKSSSIIVTGDGGDELFGGYVFRYKKFLDSISDRSSWKEKTKSYLNCHNRDWVEDQNKMFGSKINFSWDSVYQNFQKYFDNSLNPLDQVFLADYNGKLMYDWFPGLDKIHSYFGMKSIHPLINPETIKFSCKLSSEKKYNSKTNQGKLILRKMSENKKIPINNSKKGFSPNLIQFWQSFGNEMVQTYLKNSRISQENYVNEAWISTALEKANKFDIRYINKLLSVLSFEIWYRLLVTKEIKSNDTLL
jgi:asparagine synthase (glutamine-hydrolysing)